MNKKIVGVGLAALILATFCIVFSLSVKKMPTDQEIHSPEISPEISDPIGEQAPSTETLSDPTADKLLATFGVVGQEYTLHSHNYQQGEVREEDVPSLNWDGDMKLLVKSVKILPFDETAVYEENDPRNVWTSYAEQFQDPCILHFDLRLDNVDASNRMGVQYQFNASMFFLSAYEDLMPENKGNPDYINITQKLTSMESFFDKNSGTKDYWSFELRPGESMDFALEFLMDRSYLEQQSPFLAVSLNWDIKAGVLLSSIEKE